LDNHVGLYHVQLLVENLLTQLFIFNPYHQSASIEDILNPTRSTFDPTQLSAFVEFVPSYSPAVLQQHVNPKYFTQLSTFPPNQPHNDVLIPSDRISFVSFMEHAYRHYTELIPSHFSSEQLKPRTSSILHPLQVSALTSSSTLYSKQLQSQAKDSSGDCAQQFHSQAKQLSDSLNLSQQQLISLLHTFTAPYSPQPPK
jgi:hypothetical protein